MPYCIYTATDLTTDKKFDYFGLTTRTFDVRIDEHLSGQGHASLLTEAMAEKGKENFVFEEFYYLLDDDEDYLKETEKVFIAKYQTHESDGGYNKSRGGQGAFGCKRTKEQRKRQSDYIKANPIPNKQSPETRKKVSKAQSKYQQSKTPEQRKAFSEKMKMVRRKWIAENPDAMRAQVDRMNQVLAENPELKSETAKTGWVKRKGKYVDGRWVRLNKRNTNTGVAHEDTCRNSTVTDDIGMS